MKDSIVFIDNTISIMPSISTWFWIAVIEFLIIVWLFRKFQKLKRNNLDLSDVKKSDLWKSGNIDINNLMNSIHYSRELYKELSKKCHPDRFVNTPKQEIAEEIFQRISKNKRNYEQLIFIKEEAIDKLNINF